MSTKTSDQPPDAEQQRVDVAAIERAAKARIIEARTKLLELTDALLTAESRKVPRLLFQIQRLRVAIQAYGELSTGVISDDIAKEILALSKADAAALEGDDEHETMKRLDEATASLAARGITPEAAARIARVMSTIMTASATHVPSTEPVEAPTVTHGLDPDPDFAAAGDE